MGVKATCKMSKTLNDEELKAIEDALRSARCAACELRNNAMRNGCMYSDIEHRIAEIDRAICFLTGGVWKFVVPA